VLCNASMAIFNIGININTLPLVTLGLGFGIDYGLYIVSRAIEEIQIRGDLHDAMREAMVTSGKAVSLTAVAMVLSTLAWSFSNIRFNAVMGSLLAFWMFISFVSEVTLVPALIMYLKPKFIVKEAARARQQPKPVAAAAAAS